MKTLLLTGSNGFLGRNVLSLLRDNYRVLTLDLREADIICNLANNIFVSNERIDIVLHAAGKAHIKPKNESERQAFFDVNYQGTVNLCHSFEQAGKFPESFIFISTVAVYGRETGEIIAEDEPLNCTSPYGQSKIMAETFLTNWCNHNGVKLTILRPSLLAGKNPPGNLGAMIKGIESGRYFTINGGQARKSVLMVQDIARLVPLTANIGGVFNVCSDEHPSFYELESLILNQLNKKTIKKIPFWVASVLAKSGDLLGGVIPFNTEKLNKITKPLTFNNEKAKSILKWQPMSVLNNFEIV